MANGLLWAIATELTGSGTGIKDPLCYIMLLFCTEALSGRMHQIEAVLVTIPGFHLQINAFQRTFNSPRFSTFSNPYYPSFSSDMHSPRS